MDKRKRLLVVDDDVLIVDFFRMALEDEGYTVETAFTGEQALKAVKSTKFDLVILDIFLPDIKGDRIVEKIREENNDVRIILITGHETYARCVDVLKLGISEILVKPIKLNELVNQVKNVLETPIFRHSNVNAWFESRKWDTTDYS
ncbi:MAG: response regulator [Candidatus Bathyarchaeota archaeon]|nr:response regulator [Candidatus Bathyarchaeota archaeon]MDH5792517.1 response regulator [Candidatus Bathyarchaeota archaeon]